MTENFYWDRTNCTIITESELHEQYVYLKEHDITYRDSFAMFLALSCRYDLEKLARCSVFDSRDGDDVAAVLQFEALLEAISKVKDADNHICITIDGFTLRVPATDGLLQGLLASIHSYSDEII